MALRLPLCLFNRHAPNRHRVKWDGINFVGTCRFCHRPIRKKSEGAWLREWLPEHEGKDLAGHHAPPAPGNETRAE